MGKTRDEILQLIACRPGLYKTELCDETGLSWGAVTYHVDVLLDQGRITAMEEAGRVHFFANGVTDNEKQWITVLRQDLSRKIIKALGERGPSQMYELADELGVSRKIIRRHLTILEDRGAIDKAGMTRPQYRLMKGVLHRLQRAKRRK